MKYAINLIEEAESVFLDAACQIDEDLAKRLSIHDIKRIFKSMAVPAIERVRHIERFKDQPEKIKPPISNKTIGGVMDQICAEPGEIVRVNKKGIIKSKEVNDG